MNNPAVLSKSSICRSLFMCLLNHTCSDAFALLFHYYNLSFQAGSNLDMALVELRKENVKLGRTQPFLLKIKPKTFFVVVDDNAVVVHPNRFAVALDILLKSFFVFNTEYPKQLNSFYSFIQHFVYDIDGYKPTPLQQKIWSELNC